MLRSDCIACSRPSLFLLASTNPNKFSERTACHARLPRRKAPWLQRLGSTMLSFNWTGRPQENSSEPSNPSNLAGGGDDPSTTHEIRDIYENQRWIGTWQPPVAILDIAAWTDAEGNEVALTNSNTNPVSATSTSATSSQQPLPATSNLTITDSPDWEVVITPSTDSEGWQYGTVFKHLQYKRPGGRASQRFGDTCRRRAWRKRDYSVIGTSSTTGGIAFINSTSSGSGLDASQGAMNTETRKKDSSFSSSSSTATAAKARETEAKNKAIRGFITMVLDLLSRRKVWTLVPWDPAALFFLYKKHQEIYQQLQTQASQRQIFAADTVPPPSMLHRQQIEIFEKSNQAASTSSSTTPASAEQVGTATLLQDLLCATMHSRAAYGFAMAAGHITSVTSYIKLQTVQPLTFNAVAGASVEANNEAVAALAGIASEDILLSNWKNFPFRPCHYVAIDRTNQCVVISIRGTLEIGDLLSDLAAHPMEIELGGVDGWVHPGILAAASYIHCTTEDALKEAAEKCPGWPVLITGHSLGGGVAALLCILLRDRGGIPGLGSIYAITVGTAAVMSESLAALCEEYVISLVLGSDAIPHLSYASVERLLVEASEASPVRRAAEGLKKKFDSVLSITNSITNSISGGGSGGSGRMNGAAVSAAAAAAAASSGGGGSAEQQRRVGLAELLVDSNDKAKNTNDGNNESPPLVPIIDLSKGEEYALEEERKKMSNKDAQLASHPILPREQEGKEDYSNDADMNDVDTEAPTLPQQPSVVPVLHEEDISILNYTCLDADTGLAAAAMAQQQSRQPGDGSINTDTNTATRKEDQKQQQQELQHVPSDAPELLFPPGKILWIFPADEDVSSLAESGEDAVDEVKMEEAWDTAWEGTVVNKTIENSENISGAAAEAEAREGMDLGKEKGSSRGVNIDEAEAQVVASHKNKDQKQAQDTTKEESTPAAAAAAAAAPVFKKSVPVVVEADRSAFERLLLMPDSLNDHLPHRILEALQQL